MKTRTLAPFFAAAALCLGGFTANAQEPVSTGIIQGVVPALGALTLRSDQTTRPITFYGIDRANIFTADGQALVVDDLQPGMRVTVQYAAQGRNWVISKIILNGQSTPAIVGAPVVSDPVLRDGDITTQPTGRAAVDGDITTRPATLPRVPVRRRGP